MNQQHPRLLKDAIHDSIELSELELRVLDSTQMQRLRFVRQLSTAYLVYPSAMHTRFEHSLGAMHLTGVLASRLGFDAQTIKTLRLAALLHDVGHGAFAHTSDPVLVEKLHKKHEERGIDLVKKTGLKKVVEDGGVSLSELSNLMHGGGEGAVITRELGTDRVDYLLRDAHFTGVAYSIIDADRLLHTLAYADGELFVEERGLLAAESLLVSRHFMFKAVYYHPTCRIAGEMVASAMRIGLADGSLSVDDIALGTDERLLLKMQASGIALASRLLERKLYKSAFVLDAHSASARAREKMEERNFLKPFSEHMEEAGFAQGEYVVCAPETHTSEFKTRVVQKDGRKALLEDASNLVRALELERKENTLIVATAPEDKARAEKAAKGFFA